MISVCHFYMYWSKSRFIPRPLCDTLVNNMSETFNSIIVQARSKPIVSMMEEIHLYMMQRWDENRSKEKSFKNTICTRIKTRLDNETTNSTNWTPRYF